MFVVGPWLHVCVVWSLVSYKPIQLHLLLSTDKDRDVITT